MDVTQFSLQGGAREVWEHHALLSARRASTTALIGVVQSPWRVWRKRRVVRYQGESVRSSSQRSSPWKGSSVQTGLPIAPARWATDVSAEMTRSRFSISAAV